MEAPEDLRWLRPHPLTIIVEVVASIRQLALPLAVVLLGDGGGLDSLFELVVVLGPFGLAAARFLSTRYAIDDQAVYHRFGVFNRTLQVLPRRNVQNVATRSQLIARLTKLTELQISDASAQGDIHLRLLSGEEAERITALLRGSSGFAGDFASPGLVQQRDGSVVPAPPRPALVETSLGDLVKASVGYGLSMGSLFASAFGLICLLGLLQAVRVTEAPVGTWVVVSAAVPLILVITLPLAVGSIVSLTGFQMWADPDRIRSEAGLLTQARTAARRERVQIVQVDRQAVLRRLGLERVRFATADQDARSGMVGSFLDPAGQLDAWPLVASAALGTIDVSASDLIKVDPLTRRRVLVRFAVLAAVLVLASGLAVVVGQGILGSLLVAAAAAVALFGDWFSRRRHERLGYAVGPTQMMLRTGAIDERLQILRKEKVQSVRLTQTYFQRRAGLASLDIGTAGSTGLGRLRVPDLSLERAEALVDHLARVSSSTPLKDTI